MLFQNRKNRIARCKNMSVCPCISLFTKSFHGPYRFSSGLNAMVVADG
jgi:hypothetical protein